MLFSNYGIKYLQAGFLPAPISNSLPPCTSQETLTWELTVIPFSRSFLHRTRPETSRRRGQAGAPAFAALPEAPSFCFPRSERSCPFCATHGPHPCLIQTPWVVQEGQLGCLVSKPSQPLSLACTPERSTRLLVPDALGVAVLGASSSPSAFPLLPFAQKRALHRCYVVKGLFLGSLWYLAWLQISSAGFWELPAVGANEAQAQKGSGERTRPANHTPGGRRGIWRGADQTGARHPAAMMKGAALLSSRMPVQASSRPWPRA